MKGPKFRLVQSRKFYIKINVVKLVAFVLRENEKMVEILSKTEKIHVFSIFLLFHWVYPLSQGMQKIDVAVFNPSQMTNFRLFRTERVGRQQLRAISPFSTVLLTLYQTIPTFNDSEEEGF